MRLVLGLCLLGLTAITWAQPPRPSGVELIGAPLVRYRTITLPLPNGQWTTATIRTVAWTYRDATGALQVYAESEAITPLPHGTWRDQNYLEHTVIPGRLPDGSRTTFDRRGEAEHFTPRYVAPAVRYYRP